MSGNMEITDLEVVYSGSDTVPNDGVPKLDIIFVHGLNPRGDPLHSEHTWSADGGLMWPRDLLPKKIPYARIMIFKYNSSVAWDVSEAGIQKHAETLLDLVEGIRSDTGTKSIPIILVGHSLGGLIIKQALVEAKQNDRVYSRFRNCTKSIVFFATPHRGGNGTTLGQIAVNAVTFFSGSRNDLVDSLKKDSKYLAQLSANFAHQNEDYTFLSVVETRGMMKTPIRTVVVDSSSAIIGLAGHREQVVTLDRDHSTICKFVEGPDFNRIARHLKALSEAAVESCNQPTALNPEVLVSATHNQMFPTNSRLYSTLEFVPQGEFIGQAGILETLSVFVDSTTGHYLLLKGAAGSGKSSVVRQLASRLQGTLSIIWLSAESAEALQHSFKSAAHRLCREKFSTTKAQSHQLLVHDWLSDAANGKWLVIINDAFAGLDLKTLLPASKGKVLVTSRYANIETPGPLLVTEMSPLSSDDALNLFLLKRRKPSGAIPSPIPSRLPTILQPLLDVPLAIVMAASCVATMQLDTALAHLGMLDEETMLPSGNIHPTLWKWFNNLVTELDPVDTSVLCLLAMYDNSQLSDEFIDLMRCNLSSHDMIVTNRQFKPSIQRLVSLQLVDRRGDPWTQYHFIRPAIQECLIRYLHLHSDHAQGVADVGSFLLHAACQSKDFQDVVASETFFTAISPHCRAFFKALHLYSIPVSAMLSEILPALSSYYIKQGVSEMRIRCRTQFWRTWLLTNNFQLPEGLDGEEEDSLYIEPAAVPVWVLDGEGSSSSIQARINTQLSVALFTEFWNDLSGSLMCASVGQSWHGIREEIFTFARELPTAPRDNTRIDEITNSIDKGGCSGLQAAVVQTIYEETLKEELMSNGRREAIRDIAHMASDGLTGIDTEISSETLEKAISNALTNFTWSAFQAFGPPFKLILEGVPKSMVCNVIEPSMVNSADVGGFERVTQFMVQTVSATPFTECSRRLARGYWEVVGGLTVLFAASILNQLSFSLCQRTGASPRGEPATNAVPNPADPMITRSLELLREAVMNLMSKQDPGWAYSLRKATYWCLQAENCRNGWAAHHDDVYQNQELWEESCIYLGIDAEHWPLY